MLCYQWIPVPSWDWCLDSSLGCPLKRLGQCDQSCKIGREGHSAEQPPLASVLLAQLITVVSQQSGAPQPGAKAGYSVVLLAPGVTSQEAGCVDHGKKTDEISLFQLRCQPWSLSPPRLRLPQL